MISVYLGFGLTVAAVAEYLLRMPLGRAALTTRNHDLAIGFGAAISIVSVAVAGEPLWPGVAAGVVAVGWFAVTKTQLRLPSKPMAIATGDALPDLSVKRTDGSAFSTAELAAAAPAVLVLYRGKW